MVPFFFPTVLETVPSDWSIHLLRGPEHPPTICNSSRNLLLPAANTAIARATRQFGRERRFPAWRRSYLEVKAGENLRGSGVLTRGRKVQQNKPGRGQGNLPWRSRRRKRRSPREKREQGPVRWIRPLYLHDENDSPHVVLPSIFGCCCWEKKGGLRYVPDLPSESFLQQI